MEKIGRFLGGASGGLADLVPATIEQVQPAALSDGEYVIPADVVSMLGDGNSKAGARVLDELVKQIRELKTGSKKQAPALLDLLERN